jgi:hypothetical protein
MLSTGVHFASESTLDLGEEFDDPRTAQSAFRGGTIFALQRVDLKGILGNVDANSDIFPHGRPPSWWRSSDHLAALANNGSRKARARSDGRGYHATHSPLTLCGSSFTPSPTISATSCARSPRPSRSKDGWLTSLKEKLIKIGAKVVSHGRYVAFQMAEVAIPRNLFADILRLAAELRPAPVTSTG